MEQQQLIPHLFRTEHSKITAVLCKLMGVDHLTAAEDIASETFLAAIETWTYNGLPPNPTAWLYKVAKNKALNHIHRHQLFNSNIKPQLHHSLLGNNELQVDLSEENIMDSQLQMLFVICHPSIPAEAQIGLALRVLCGFGIDEIANAFLSSKETISKRLQRAKDKLRELQVSIRFPSPHEIQNRLHPVLTTIYLLFNEGYYSENNNAVLRQELCFEAIRLCKMLTERKETNSPPVNALLALMYLHASRFKARQSAPETLALHGDQDENLWDTDLINKGIYYLHQGSQGDHLTTYHLEATIAYWHTQKADTPEKWEKILSLFDQLLLISNNPVVAVNRLYALAKVKGNKTAIKEGLALHLPSNQYYHFLMGKLYSGLDDARSQEYYFKALALAKTNHDKATIMNEINKLETIRN